MILPYAAKTHKVETIRAFTTVRRVTSLSTTRTATPRNATPPLPSLSSPAVLTRAFSGLSLRSCGRSSGTRTRPSFSTPLINSSILRPSLQNMTATTSVSPAMRSISSPRLFSTTSALMGHRRRMDTFSPSRRIQKRRHGYLARVRTKSGQAILKRRALKGRKYLSW